MKIAVMYSGGADSTLCLYKAIKHHGEAAVLAVYVDFDCPKTNPNREQNWEHVFKATQKFGVDLLVETVKPEANGKGPEGNARIGLKRVQKWAEENFDTVYVGHNKDDHIETVLIQLFRGAGKGTRGIPDYHIGRIYRPLLTLTREEVRKWCDRLSLEYFDDPSNVDTSMTRSFWRNEIIPKLKEHYGDGIYKRISKIGDKFNE